jgi:prepilin-type N-terminal cleavage/methylation domain-containing protein
MRRPKKHNSGLGAAFTLVELLVVVAVIALIASLLLPALGKAKEKGREARCVSNLKQLGVAFHLYLGDYNERFPAAAGEGCRRIGFTLVTRTLGRRSKAPLSDM